MIRVISLMGLLLCAHAVCAQDNCDYANTKGVDFEFAQRAEQLQHYGYMMWSADKPIPAGSLPYADYVGKKGKFLGTLTGNGRLRYHDALLENCQRVFHLATEEELPSAQVLAGFGVTLVGRPSVEWTTREPVDEMTDERSCIVEAKTMETPFPIFVYTKAGVAAGAVGGDFPGKDVSFRVDKQPAISQTEELNGANAQRLVQQIRGGGKALLVRAYKWPDDVPKTREFNLEGLIAVLDKCEAKTK